MDSACRSSEATGGVSGVLQDGIPQASARPIFVFSYSCFYKQSPLPFGRVLRDSFTNHVFCVFYGCARFPFGRVLHESAREFHVIAFSQHLCFHSEGFCATQNRFLRSVIPPVPAFSIWKGSARLVSDLFRTQGIAIESRRTLPNGTQGQPRNHKTHDS